MSDHSLVIGALVTPKSPEKALRAASHPRRPKPSVAERAKTLIRRRRRPPKGLHRRPLRARGWVVSMVTKVARVGLV